MKYYGRESHRLFTQSNTFHLRTSKVSFVFFFVLLQLTLQGQVSTKTVTLTTGILVEPLAMGLQDSAPAEGVLVGMIGPSMPMILPYMNTFPGSTFTLPCWGVGERQLA